MDPVASWRQTDHWSPRRRDAHRIDARVRRDGAGWILVPEKNLRRVLRLGLSTPVFALRSRIRWDDDRDPLRWLRERGVGI
jgi:hypothetical protein